MHRDERGVCYVVYGEKARGEAELSIQSLRLFHDWPITAIGEHVVGAEHVKFPQVDKGGRWAKVNLDKLSPYQMTLYIDADTRPHGDLSAGFEILTDGWDLAMTPSTNQGEDWLWHVGGEECAVTLKELGFQGLQLQAGLMFIGRNERTARLFKNWRNEWMQHKGEDQGALLRAMQQVPCKVWLLGRPWNGGALVDHRFGMLRRL